MPLPQFVAPPRTPRKEETRRRLLDAALGLVAEKGFGSASLAEIAARAGVTTGAVYSNFRSKEALLLELIEDLLRGTRVAPQEFPPAGDPEKPVLQHLIDSAVAGAHYVSTPESRRLAVLQVELVALALRDRAVRRDLQRGGRDLVSKMAAVLANVGDVPPPDPLPSLEQLAEVYFAGLQGLQQHRLIDTSAAPDSLFEWFVRAVLFAASASRSPKRR